MKVLIGVDPHKERRWLLPRSTKPLASSSCALASASFPQDRAGLRRLQRWAKRFPERRWAMENAGGLGRHLAGRLVAAGESVVDVPPKLSALSARVRVLSSGNTPKNDGLDALATALAASRNGRLRRVDPEAASEALRLLSERREDLVAERTRALNRLHGLLRDLLPGGLTGKLSADRGARILRAIRSKGASDRLRRRLASEILREVRALDRKVADLDGRIEAEVEASGTTLTEIFGVGPILAARIIGTLGNAARFPSKAHFASPTPVQLRSRPQAAMWCATGSLCARQPQAQQSALHMVAVCQASSDARGGAYYRKKIAEGKSPKEALRCLKRGVCDAVFRSLVADLQAPSSSAA